MLQRTGKKTDYDALKGFDKYVRGATDLIYHTNDIQNLRALSLAIRGSYNDAEIQNRIEEINEMTTLDDLQKESLIKEILDTAKNKSHLSKFVEWLDNYINILAGKKAINDRGAEKELSRTMYNTMQSVESRFAGNAIGGNVGVSLTNFLPLAQAVGETNPIYLISGMAQTAISKFKGDNSFVSESSFITRRRGIDSLSKNTFNKITDILQSPLEFADNFTSEVLVRAKYTQNLKRGMSKQTALENADSYVAGLMADRGRGALPTQFNNKSPIAKMMNMFQVEVNNQWSYYFKDLPNNIKTEFKNSNKAKVVSRIAVGYTGIMIASHLANELLAMIKGSGSGLPDPIEIAKILIEGLGDDDDNNDVDTIVDAFNEFAGNIPFISTFAALFGNDDLGRIPLTGMLPDLTEITGDIVNVANGSESVNDGIENVTKELLSTLGASMILPWGGSQIKKTINGLSMYDEDLPVTGSYTDNGDLRFTADISPLGKIQSALFGQYAGSEAQKYVDSDYKTISEKDIEEMLDLNMKSSEYRNYKQGLSNSGSSNENKIDQDNESNIVNKNEYYSLKNDLGSIDSNYDDKKKRITFEKGTEEYENASAVLSKARKAEITNKIINSNLSDSEKLEVYKSYYNSTNIDIMSSAGIDANSIMNYQLQEFTSDQDENGKTISGSRKDKVISYVNSLNLSIAQKAIMIKSTNTFKFNDYNDEIVTYIVNQNNLTYKQKKTILEDIGMTVHEDGTITWE